MSIVHDLLLKILIFLLDALTYMFQQHLHMCIIHPLTFALWKNLAKTRFLHRLCVCKFSARGLG